MNKALQRLFEQSAKVKNIKHLASKGKKEYFEVNGHNVTITIEKITTVPLSKKFECTCKHASLFGTKNNIPCRHIIALIYWLVKKHKI